MKTNFTQLSVNIVGKPRFAVMEGRDYIVLPVVILMEGVHSGSNGPVLYTLEDMEKFCPAWNHKPVVVNHPKVNGEFVSADSPTILSSYKVGILMANSIEGKGQRAEAWLEKSRLKEVDERILNWIDEGLMIEVSTGLFADNEEVPGKWNEEEYDYIARNYRPDHLALLPDLIGACSIADGCGMFTASQAMTINEAKRIQKEVKTIHDNELSHGQVWSALYDKITPPPTEYSYINDVYDDYFIYYTGDKCFKQQYNTTKNDTVELVGDPTEVHMTFTYNTNKDSNMSKACECSKEVKTLADSLISANKDWKETDREWLEKQEKPILEKFATMQEAKKDEPKAKEEEAEEDPAPKVNTTPAPKKKQEVSVQEYIENSPAPIREMLVRGLQAQEAEKNRYVDIILSNEENKFTKEELAQFKPEMLQKMAALAVDSKKELSPQVVDLFNFVGGAGAPQQTSNSHSEEHLPLPTMNFASKS